MLLLKLCNYYVTSYVIFIFHLSSAEIRVRKNLWRHRRCQLPVARVSPRGESTTHHPQPWKGWLPIVYFNCMVREKTLFKLFPGWQVGYGAFTYHISMKSVLIKYIQNQEEHHRKISFKEEMIELLNENMIPFKEEYLLVWSYLPGFAIYLRRRVNDNWRQPLWGWIGFIVHYHGRDRGYWKSSPPGWRCV